MTAWFARLSLRERVMVAAAVPLALLLILYQFAWVPLQDARAARLDEIAAYRLVTGAAARRAADPTPVAAPAPADPIATRVTQSAEAAGLQLRRLEPEGTGLRVTLDDVAFADLMLWLADMQTTFAVRVAAVEVDRRPVPGVVSTRLLLEDDL